MKMSFTILWLMLSIVGFGQQFSSMKWHKGFLVTTDGDTLRGKVKYDLETNSVQIANREIIKGYSSYKVFHFEIFDEVLQNYRQFYSIPYQIQSNYKAPVLFELVFEGGVSLLAREKIVQETVNTVDPLWPSARYRRNVVDYDFFFLDKKGKITYFDGSRNRLLEIFYGKRSQIKDYIKSNRLKTDEIEDLIRITSFYNSI